MITRDIPPWDIPLKRKGGKIMKKKHQARMNPGLLVLLVAASALVLFATSSRADDGDSDGGDCLVETYGYCADIKQPLEPAAGIYLPAADDLVAFFPNNGCRDLCTNCTTDPVNPNEPDLFVILGDCKNTYTGVCAGTSLLIPPVGADPNYWLQMISKNVPGLTKKLHAHRVSRDPFTNNNRAIVMDTTNNNTPVENAVRIYENNVKDLSSGAELGITPSQGTPNTFNDITLYTYRIKQFVDQACSNKTCIYTDPSSTTPTATITLAPGSNLTGLYNVYKKQVIAHETGHTMWLTANPNTRAGGYHYLTGTGTIMDQAVYYKSAKSTVTWYFPNGYATADFPTLK